MTGLARIARWMAVAIAAGALLDPQLPLPRSERPPVRVASIDGHDTSAVRTTLKRAGFGRDPGAPAAATVIVGDRPPRSPARGAVYALDTSPRGPNVRITRTQAGQARLPEQAVDVVATIEAEGAAGRTTEIVLEDGGIPVAFARHQWTSDRDVWQTSLTYLPPAAAAGRLRLRAGSVPGETETADNVADVRVPAVRGALRTLIVEASVTWPALFVRRALEGENAFGVSTLQRASKSIATRAGAPPPALTQASLAPYEVAVLGGPDNLTASDLDALRWFVDVRGGLAVFVPDQAPTGRYLDLVGVSSFASQVLAAPAALGGDLRAAELLIPKALPPSATALASDASGSPVVFAARRGAGAVIFSGALDAWRYRAAPADTAPDANRDGFARFWRRSIASNGLGVPAPLNVSVAPAILQPGERASLTVRMRETELQQGIDRIDMDPIVARAVSADAGIDETVRLWPTAEPGVYEGEWRARRAGEYNISAVAGDLRGDAAVTVAARVAPGSSADPQGLALLARAAGGQAFPADQVPALITALKAALPSARVIRRVHPMRSPWWCVPFAALLSAEWAIRRRCGLR